MGLALRQTTINLARFGYKDEEGGEAELTVRFDLTKRTADDIKRLIVEPRYEDMAGEDQPAHLAGLSEEDGRALDEAIAATVLGSNVKGLGRPTVETLAEWRQGGAEDESKFNLYTFFLTGAIIRYYQMRDTRAVKNGSGGDGTNAAAA